MTIGSTTAAEGAGSAGVGAGVGSGVGAGVGSGVGAGAGAGAGSTGAGSTTSPGVTLAVLQPTRAMAIAMTKIVRKMDFEKRFTCFLLDVPKDVLNI
jgi:hypothetical protein